MNWGIIASIAVVIGIVIQLRDNAVKHGRAMQKMDDICDDVRETRADVKELEGRVGVHDSKISALDALAPRRRHA